MGLLDRILSVLQDNNRYVRFFFVLDLGTGRHTCMRARLTSFIAYSDPHVVDATINCLSVIARTRPNTTTRIVNVVIGFDPFRQASPTMTARTRVVVKSLEKTARMFLIHLSKRDPHHALVPRMQQQAEKLMRTRMVILDNRKRALPASISRTTADVKRQRTAGPAPVQSVIQVVVRPLGPGPHSLSTIFTLADQEGLSSFDTSLVPVGLAARISTFVLQGLDPVLLAKAVEVRITTTRTMTNTRNCDMLLTGKAIGCPVQVGRYGGCTSQ